MFDKLYCKLDELAKLLKGRRVDRRTEYQYICRLHAGEFRDREYEV